MNFSFKNKRRKPVHFFNLLIVDNDFFFIIHTSTLVIDAFIDFKNIRSNV